LIKNEVVVGEVIREKKNLVQKIGLTITRSD
jgi:hypothetical protein